MNLRPSVTSVGAILDEAQRALGASDTWAGALTTIPGLCFALAGFGAPWVARRIGVSSAVALALAVLAVGLAVRVVDGPWVVLAGTLVASAGIALANVLIPVVVKTSFAARVGLMTGVYTAALQTGGALGSAVTPPLSEVTGGWRGGLGGWAGLAVLALVLWFAATRRGAVRGGAGAGGSGAAAQDPPRRSLLRNRLAWVVTGFFGTQACFAYIMMGWMPQVLIDAGVDRTSAGLMMGLVSLLGLPVSLLVPPLVAAHGGLGFWSVGLGVLGIGGLTGLTVAPAAAPLLWSVLIGLGMAVFSLAIVSITMRARTATDTASLSGMAQGIGYLLGALGPFLFGFLRDVTGDWTVPMTMVIGVVAAQLVFGWYAGKPRYV
ncbi:MFS transporter [Saccharomonospora sp. CUA-673]|uniref:MFS transporter n=1 Tax=Saccharomonospora sp. CUA-673 TaxID=1904969 RepID=UPI002101CB83|nr:MFS transporter [Saccharomonospora sp. CUA-673]